MRFREVYRYELQYRLRSPSTWIYAGILFAMAFLTLLDQSTSVERVHVNAASELADLAIMWSILSMIITAAIFGDAALRDIHAGMDPLLYTSSLTKLDFLAGRYLAALTANLLASLAFPLCIAVFALIGYPHAEMYGPLRLGAFVQSWLLITVPNIAGIGVVMFATGILSRHMLPVLLSGVGMFFAFLWAADAETFGSWDPLGMLALEAVTGQWTLAERNTLLIGYPSVLLLNRALWLSFAGAWFVALHFFFRFRHPNTGGQWQGAITAEPSHAVAVTTPRAEISFDFRSRVLQTFAIARNSLRELAVSWWFYGILVVLTGLTMILGWNVGGSVYDTSTWPVTPLVINAVLGIRTEPIFVALIAIFAAELVWKDRDVSASEIADAAPVPDGVALLGRFLALVAMTGMFLAAVLVGSIFIQVGQLYYHFQPGLYLSVVALKLGEFVLYAALAMAIHIVVNHKYIGHTVVLLVFAFPLFAGPALGIQHHLLLYNTDPGWTYSDMNGFGPFLMPFVWFKLYWAAWALLFAAVAATFWVRGRESGLPRRVRQARARFTPPVVRTVGVAVGLIVLLGGFIFYNTNVLNEYVPAGGNEAVQAEYEKRYGHFEDAPQPTIETASLRVEIYPEGRAADLRGSYRLVNHTNASIDSVHVFVQPQMDTRSVSFDRAATAVLTDSEHGYRIYRLERALNPGEAMQLSFAVGIQQRGFRNSGIPTDVVSNGTYFQRFWLPFIGYQPGFELSDDEMRTQLGLGPQPRLRAPDDVAARGHRYDVRNEDKVRVETIVGTSADQTAITAGALRREWTENGRRYFHYEMTAPQVFAAAVVSGKYALHEDRWNDIAMSIAHHADHDRALDTFVRSMKASLEYYTAHLGPYQGSELRIIETIPRESLFGRAHPGTVLFSENAFFSHVRDGQLDQLFFGTAHEIAHHWWGGQIRGAAGVRGSQGFISESLANYSALMVMEKTFGIEAARRAYTFQMGHYFRAREQGVGEVPLLEMEYQPYIMYRKGLLAMYLLREYIGEPAVNTALRRFVDKHRAGVPPYPTALDVCAELRAVTPDSLQYLLTDLFETVTLWDVSTRRASVEQTATGEYVVTIDVVAKKVRVDNAGDETEVPMDDVIEIGVYAPADGDARRDPLYLKPQRIRSGEQTIRITVPRMPASAGIDPLRKLIDRYGYDNVVVVEASGDDARGS